MGGLNDGDPSPLTDMFAFPKMQSSIRLCVHSPIVFFQFNSKSIGSQLGGIKAREKTGRNKRDLLLLGKEGFAISI